MRNRMRFRICNSALQCMCLSRHSFDDTGSFVFTCSLFFSLLHTLSAFHLLLSFTNDSFFTTRGMNSFTTCNFFTNTGSFTANTQTCFPSTQPRHSVHREAHSTPVGLDNPLLFGILLSSAFSGPPRWLLASLNPLFVRQLDRFTVLVHVVGVAFRAASPFAGCIFSSSGSWFAAASCCSVSACRTRSPAALETPRGGSGLQTGRCPGGGGLEGS